MYGRAAADILCDCATSDCSCICFLYLYLYLYELYLCLFVSDGWMLKARCTAEQQLQFDILRATNNWSCIRLLYLCMYLHLYLYLYLMYLCLLLSDGCLKQDVGRQSSGG